MTFTWVWLRRYGLASWLSWDGVSKQKYKNGFKKGSRLIYWWPRLTH